jgi:hypothetical protein
VSLRKCPDCYKDVSSSAPSCPHCGRRRKKSHLAIEIVMGLSITSVCLVALAWSSGPQDAAVNDTVASSITPETAIARPYQLERSLSAFVGYNRTLHIFRVENRDTFPWTNCLLSLNSHGISGYELEVESIEPGLTEAALLQSVEFADPDGNKFDPSTDKVATLDLDCESTHGRLYYRGKFGLESSANRAGSAARNGVPSTGGGARVATAGLRASSPAPPPPPQQPSARTSSSAPAVRAP